MAAILSADKYMGTSDNLFKSLKPFKTFKTPDKPIQISETV